jgi:hypothetical protein
VRRVTSVLLLVTSALAFGVGITVLAAAPPIELGATPAHGQSTPSASVSPEPASGDDLDLDRIGGPREADSTPGRAAGLPLALAALAIMIVTIVVIVRARGARADGGDQLADGSGGQ